MAKADFYFTLHLWGDNDDIKEVDSDEMQEVLDGMIDDLLGSSDEFNFKADLTNNLTGITVTRSKEAENG